MALAAVLTAFAFPQTAGAHAPRPSANESCDKVAVVAKLRVVEDRAAANMLAEAARILGLGGRCLVDAGDPSTDWVPSGSGGQLAHADRVFVVGGPAAIPDSWMASELGVSGYVRVAGGNRWATQSAAAAAMVSLARSEPVVEYSGQPASSPTLPPNTGCINAVAVKLTVVEDRAAANMLAETFNHLAANGDDRCLVDVGVPGTQAVPAASAVVGFGSARTRYVVGGVAAIPSAWLDRHFGEQGRIRLAGTDRWATQAAVAAAIIGVTSRPVGRAGDALATAGSRLSDNAGPKDFKNTTVVVHYCGYERSRWDQDRLAREVSRLSAVTDFYKRQFGRSGFTLGFRSGELLTPDSMPSGSNASIAYLHEIHVEQDMGEMPCRLELDSVSGDGESSGASAPGEIDMFVVDVSTDKYCPPGAKDPEGCSGVSAWAGLGRNDIYVATPEQYVDNVIGGDYLTVVAHEVGHSAYDLLHPWPERPELAPPKNRECHDDVGNLGIDELASVMSYTWPDPPCSRRPIQDGHIACVDLERSWLQWRAPGACIKPLDLSSSYNGSTWIHLEARAASANVPGAEVTLSNFNIQYRALPHGAWTTVTPTRYRLDGDLGNYVFEISALHRLANYEVRVRQCDDIGCSGWSIHRFRTEVNVPPPPDVRVAEVGRDYFLLEWDSVPYAYSYDIHYTGGGRIVGTNIYDNKYHSNDPRFEEVKLDPGTEYTVIIKSCSDLRAHGDFGADSCNETGTTVKVTTSG